MYHAQSNKAAMARTSNLNEELGMVIGAERKYFINININSYLI